MNGTSSEGPLLIIIHAVDRETVQDVVDFSLLICRSKVALQEVSSSGRSWVRADSRVLCLQRTLPRLELAGNARVFVLPGRFEYGSVRANSDINLGNLEALALTYKVHALSILLILQRQRLLDRVEFNEAGQYGSIRLNCLPNGLNLGYHLAHIFSHLKHPHIQACMLLLVLVKERLEVLMNSMQECVHFLQACLR